MNKLESLARRIRIDLPRTQRLGTSISPDYPVSGCTNIKKKIKTNLVQAKEVEERL